ncbi:hypothetical protein ZIOFF_011451 [Zingiber officinale]|uniref:Uncharacterized protein n=1 Tax=Zingiber officinale TaxID=94328 RepID=A0A8J5I820_ZINOF|nr:hypothetical protein ZIOFF_011451 [Zingiber officinale]
MLLNELASPYGNCEQCLDYVFLQALFCRAASDNHCYKSSLAVSERIVSFASTRRLALKFQERPPPGPRSTVSLLSTSSTSATPSAPVAHAPRGPRLARRRGRPARPSHHCAVYGRAALVLCYRRPFAALPRRRSTPREVRALPRGGRRDELSLRSSASRLQGFTGLVPMGGAAL